MKLKREGRQRGCVKMKNALVEVGGRPGGKGRMKGSRQEGKRGKSHSTMVLYTS